MSAVDYNVLTLLLSAAMLVSTASAVWACLRRGGYESQMAAALVLAVFALFLASIRNLELLVAADTSGTPRMDDAVFRVILLALRVAVLLITASVTWDYIAHRSHTHG